jgi:hypothetical protein
MRCTIAALVVASSLLTVSAPAEALTIDLSQAVLAGGASLIGGGSKVQFDSQMAGESATFILPSISGQDYSIQVTGHNNASTSFFQFLIDADGPGPGGSSAATSILEAASPPLRYRHSLILEPRTSSE